MMAGVVLAGRRNNGKLAAVAPGCAWEALVPIEGRPMAGYVIAALRALPEMGRVVVAGPEALGSDGVVTVEPGAGVTGSLQAALAALEDDASDEVLIATGDAPLLSAVALGDLVRLSRQRGLSFGYPIVGRPVCEQQFPGVRRTYVRLRQGSFTGGNCFYLRREAAPGVQSLLERVYRDRKHPVRLAGLLGWGTVIAVALGLASVRDLERAGSRLLGVSAGAVVMADAGVGVDVDKPADLELCRKVLGR